MKHAYLKRTLAVAAAFALCLSPGSDAVLFAEETSAVSAASETEIVNTVPTMASIVNISSGAVRGYNYNGTYTFKGIPYATAERFGMPQKAEAWEGVRSALVYGSIAPQNMAYAKSPDSSRFSEYANSDLFENEADCLNLNVWTQSVDPEAKKPVIVWLHGGGFGSGASSELATYDGTNISKKGDVVFVSINHRLNVLGYMDLSAYGEEYKYSGNAGTADIVAALEWVQENIEAFGGDPSNVTIIGQSGGGGKVMALLGTPAAQGLFQKAWVMSGGVSGRTTEEAQAQTQAIVDYLGITENIPEALKALPYDELLAAANACVFSASPVVDGDYYPAETIDENGAFTELAKDIPVVISTVYAETSGVLQKLLFEQQDAVSAEDITGSDAQAAVEEKYGEHAQEIIDAFQSAYPDKDLVDVLYIDAGRSNDSAVSKANQGGAPVYQAVFAWKLPVFGGTQSWHTGGDVPFIFANADKEGYLIAGDEAGAYAYQDVCAGALINYAYTGNPSPDGIEWTPFTVENGETMIFDTNSEVRGYHDRELLSLINEYAPAEDAWAGMQAFLQSQETAAAEDAEAE